MGKINDVVRYLADLPCNLFSGSQVQLDGFARVALQDVEHSSIRLEGSFLLRLQAGTGDRCNNDSK